jgi:hypothetical protein
MHKGSKIKEPIVSPGACHGGAKRGSPGAQGAPMERAAAGALESAPAGSVDPRKIILRILGQQEAAR